MVSIAGISLWSFLLLMQAYMVVPGSFGGELSGALSYNKAEILRYGRSSVRKIYENLDPRFSHRVPDRIRVRSASFLDILGSELIISVHHLHRSESASLRTCSD
jgi:hypothetical protein